MNTHFTAGNLSNQVEDWRNIGAPVQVINWLEEGVKIPFVKFPQGFELLNHKFSVTQAAFVSAEIRYLVAYGAVERCIRKPKCSSPLGVVPKQNHKYRLIRDLRRINDNCNHVSFQYDDIRTVSDIIQANDHLISVDL